MSLSLLGPRRGRLGTLLSTALLVTLGWSSPALAQGKLQLGQSGSGTLGAGDPRASDSTYYDDWTYSGKAGETIRVTLTSSDFDAWLLVGRTEGGEFSQLDFDDDGNGGTNSKIVITLPDDGEYTIRANCVSPTETGAYTVLVEQGDPSEVTTADAGDSSSGESVATPLPDPVAIHAGQTLTGELSQNDAVMEDTSFYDLYSFSAKRGQRVTAIMRSTAFDSYLALGRVENGSFTQLDANDDDGGGEDAKIEYDVTRDGDYVLRANSLFKQVTGAYSIQLQTGAAPPPVPLTTSPIRVGQTVSGDLSETDPEIDDHSHFDLYRFTGKRGDKLVITMKSTAFDTYLGFGRLENNEYTPIDSNDDGGGGTDSQLTVTLDADGEYVIRANSVFPRATGAYTVNLARGR